MLTAWVYFAMLGQQKTPQSASKCVMQGLARKSTGQSYSGLIVISNVPIKPSEFDEGGEGGREGERGVLGGDR